MIQENDILFSSIFRVLGCALIGENSLVNNGKHIFGMMMFSILFPDTELQSCSQCRQRCWEGELSGGLVAERLGKWYETADVQQAMLEYTGSIVSIGVEPKK